jgi:hypothetical protein
LAAARAGSKRIRQFQATRGSSISAIGEYFEIKHAMLRQGPPTALETFS